MTWLEIYTFLAGPAVVLGFGAWLAYDANRWRWHRSICKAEGAAPPRTRRRG